MLPRSQRLTRGHFTASQKTAKRLSGEYFTLVVSPSPVFRGAVVVSKKVAAKAVLRNLIKRRVMHVLEKNPPLPGTYVVYAKKGAAALPFSKIEEEVTSLLKKIKSV